VDLAGFELWPLAELHTQVAGRRCSPQTRSEPADDFGIFLEDMKMRKNLPVTNVELTLNDDTLIVSKTDPKGKLVYFNKQFVHASGFTEAELMGQPHNIVRHPDMPPEAFEDLWTTIKAGMPWAGAVKNRRKNGDFYWVRASATPIWENGQIAGYMSIRTKLPAEQRTEAEQVYALIRAKQAHKYTVTAGLIRRRSLADSMLRRFKMTVGRKIYALIGLSFIGVVGIASLDSREMASGLDQQKQVELRHLTELALGIVKEEHAAVQTSGVAVADAQKRALARMAALRYGNNDYFWVNDMQPRMVMHPMKPEMNGTDISGFKDPNGKALFVDMVGVVKKDGAGFVAYEWPKPGVDKPQPKLSYVTGFAPWGWVIGTGVYIDDLRAQSWASTERGLIAAGLVLLLTLAVSIIVARRITGPLRQMTTMMNALARGRLDVRVAGLDRHDEVGEMAKAVEVFKSNAVARQALEAEAKESEVRAVDRRKADMNKMADDFESAVGEIVQTVSSASTELEASAGTLTTAAAHAQELTIMVAAASEEASTNVQSVASATEEMTSSINKISRQVQESARMAAAAVDQARTTNDRVGELSKAAARIGDVVELINTIAGQTNLLALNATIEAARAGESGRGFAVVASEVKALAEQTAKATGEIGQQISSIQQATQESVGAIREISGTIEKLSEISSTIAAAVEEQGAATQEISRNVQQAAHGTQQVSSHIIDVQQGASETGSASSHVLSAAQSLSSDSNRLKLEVGRFLNSVRVA
jgi:methyl-accepting chemotaxis protein